MHRQVDNQVDGQVERQLDGQLQRQGTNKGMVLPFRPLNLAFSHMYYSVDLPPVSPHSYWHPAPSNIPWKCMIHNHSVPTGAGALLRTCHRISRRTTVQG